MKSMSGDIDYGVGPKTAKIRDVIDEIANWPGRRCSVFLPVFERRPTAVVNVFFSRF
jgi:hypothetical protein